MNLAELRKTMPSISGLSDQAAVDVVHQVYYPGHDKAEVARALGVAMPAPPAPPQAGVLRTAGDVGIKLAQGAVDLGSSAVGLGSLATGGLVGKGMRAIGYDPKATNEALGQYLSDSQKASDHKVADADGFVNSIAAAVQNPRAILGSVAESAPGMLAGMGVQGAVARGIAAKAALATGEGAAASAAQLAAGKGAAEATKAALATTAGKSAATEALDAASTKLVALGAGTEGAQSAGQIADDAQAAGRKYTDYALPAIAAGVGTAGISLGAGKLMGDAGTQIATGSHAAGVKGNMATRAAKEFLSEGVLEEMPQSAQEQVFTNIAQGENDITKGVGNAAGTGLVTGGVMGVGLGGLQHENHAPATAPALPNTGPLSQAANAGQAAIAATANATAPQGTTTPAAPVAPLEEIDARMAQLVALGRGQLAGRTQDAAGNLVAVPAVPGRPLTPEETAEYNVLKQQRAQRTAIPADQQAEFQAALSAEQAAQDQKHQATMQASAQARSQLEDQQIAQMLAQDAAQQHQAEQDAQQQAIAASDARVEQGRIARAVANRTALRDSVANDLKIPAAEKAAAFRKALTDEGYINNTLSAEDRVFFKEAAAPLPSAPNELIDAVPERVAPAAAPRATNTQAVDDAIAAGMRLKTSGGKVLVKKGSSKVFNLSTEQKAYYQQAMERVNNGELFPQNGTSVAENSPIVAENDVSVPEPAAPVAQAEPAAEPLAGAFDQAAHEAATSPHNALPEPTAAQKEAGNYKLGKVRLQGLDLSIENPAGSTRKGVDKDGTPWETTMAHHYGYLRGTIGADKDHIDAFVGANHDSDKVFVVDQVHPDSRQFDEHKVMLGFDTIEQARDAYRANYAPDWTGGDRIAETSMDGFKAWLDKGNTKKPITSGSLKGITRVEDVVQRSTPVPVAATEAAPAVEAPTVASPAPLTKQQLNKKTVKDMSDAELLAARDVFAGGARAPKVDKEIAERGLNVAAPAVAPAEAATPAAPAPTGMLENATAPEHIQAGVDDRELGQIVAEFNDAQAEMMGGEHAVSNVFQPPKKGDVVRLAEKSKAKLWNPAEVKAYNKQLAERDELAAAGAKVPAELTRAIADFEALYLPHIAKLKAEAAVEIGNWQQHARAQGIDPATRAANGRKIVLSLFDLSGEWSRPWEEAGYQVYRFDIQDDPQVGDVNNFSSEFFGDWFGDFDGLDVYAILAATPCTDFAVSGARHFAAKDKDGRTVASVKLVHQTLRTIEYFKPSIWALENPVGRIESLGGLPPWRLSFDPNHLGDSYTKKTLIWGRFNGDLPVAPVEPTEGSKMHKLYGGKSMATKNARSVTPEGFSYGFFMANNAIDHPVMAIANKFDRLDRDAIAQAVAAGATEDDITHAVEDHYYMDMDDDAANAALRDLAAPEAHEATAPVLRPAPEIADLKTYTTKQAQQEWDDARPAKREMVLGRIEQRDADLADLSWDEMTVEQHALVKHALNEDFYAPAWYVNTEGKQISRSSTPAPVSKSAAQLDEEKAGARWGDLPANERHRLLTQNGIGKDAEQGQFAHWQALAPELRERMTPDLIEAPGKMAPTAAGEREAIARHYAALLARDGVSDEPKEFHYKFADQLLAKDAYGLKWIANGLNDKAKKVFAEFSGVKLPKAQGASWTAIKNWAGVTPEQDAAHQAAEAAARDEQREREEADIAERAAAGQKFRTSATDDTIITGKDAIDSRIAAGYTSIENISTSPIPKYVLVNVALGRYYPIDKVGRKYAEVALKRLGQSAITRDTDGDSLQSTEQAAAEEADHARELADAQAKGQTMASADDVSHLFGKRAAPATTGAVTVEKPGDMPDTDTHTTGNDNDTSHPTHPSALDRALAQGQRPAGSDAPARGAELARAGDGRADDRGLREPRGLSEGADDGQQDVGHAAGVAAVPDRSHDAVAGSDGRVPANDYRPPVGGLTREGSWYDTARRNVDLIELALRIEQEGRPATPEEQAQLAKYVGFGASDIRNKLFPVPTDMAKRQNPERLLWPQFVAEARWRELAERMEALPRDWQKSVLQSSQYAHYTSEGIIRSVWDAAQRMGFTGGKVFEPGMGIGSFAMLMPESVRASSRYTGVEFDGPTATIAKLLSPEQNMLHDDFIKRKFPKDYFDIAIGNPPFSQTKIFGDADYEKNGFMLHDFFFAKSIDRVRPGGLLAFVTSKGTMDKQTDKARKYLAERADLLGAIRLPSTAFEANAGTSVVTDVIFLRKRLPGEAPAGQPWANVQTVDTKDGPVVVNEYFANHPDMVLGQQRISGNTDDLGRRINSNGRGAAQYTVVSYDAAPADLDRKFAAAIEQLPQHVYSVLGQSDASVRRETAKVDFDPSVKRDGVVYIGNDGTVMRVESGVGRPLAESAKLTAADTAWFKGYVGLRDLVQAARLAQTTDGKWEASLKQLNKAYDQFRKEHGPINDYRIQVRKSTDEDGKVVETESKIFKNRRRYREDYDAAALTQLETINEAGDIVKAPFLLGRTIGVPVTRDVKSIGDALAVSLDGVGKLDLDDVARRIGLTREEAIEALGDQVFKTPAGQWQLADEYLSGDVVAKLEEAEQAARIDPALRRNVGALSAAQPEKLGPSQISAKLGAAWIPAAHVNEFAREIEAGEVSFDPTTETWQVEGGNLRTGRRAGAEFGTAKRSPSELLEAILNSRPLKVTAITEDKKTVTDVEATTAANEAAKKIKDKFRAWVWTDAERAGELVESYNKRFNNIAPRRFDGSHLTLPGVSLRYKLHPHQLRAIWRMIQTGDTYLAHAVGAGKTIEMIAAGMEQKRLGLIQKPMYVVPNHMLEQFSNEFMELYPLANIMVADDENFSAERRKAFVASATLNKPDAVIITHDAFQRIGVKEESVAPIRDEILADLEIELSETAKGNDTRVRRSQLEQQIEAVTQRFDRIIAAGGKDSTLKFEDIGVDFIFADEAHVYRKLDFHTAQQIKGIDPNGSKRALDMYVKTRYLQAQRPGRAMAFASGTPITNTMGELYTIMRFFAPQELDRAGIATFDSWSRMFGEVAPALEPNAAGKYELVERFAKFDNVPELMSRVRQFMDVLTSEHLGALVKRPDLIGGKPHLNVVEPSDQLQAYMASELGPRIERSKRWKPSKDQPSNPDPIVAIITDGRFAALDPRFFGGQLEEGESSIITEMAAKVVANYHATADNVYLDKAGKPEAIKGSTQMVFYNLGFGEQSQINRGFNSRAAFTKQLTEGGIPRAQIAWFDDANTDAKKEAAFKGMRSGQIRVLIGSAKKMGTGVNAQKRLAVLHYQDPPWFPSDVEQPHGRIIRQGNQNDTVGIEWYTTKGTYQSTMWQMVARKQRFIDQAFTGDKSLRSMDDLGEASLFEQAAAVASGDPRAIQLAGLKQEVARLERLQAAHANEQISVRNAMSGAEWTTQSATRAIATYGAAYKAMGEKHFAFTAGDVLGVSYDKPGEFGQALKEAFNATAARSEASRKPLQDVKVAQLGDAISLTMDTELNSKDKKSGDMALTINVGDLAMAFTSVPSMGAQVDAAGLARRVFNAINSIDTDLRRAGKELAEAQTDLVRLRKKRGAPFEHQQELAEKYGDLQRLEDELRHEGVAASAAMGAQLDAEDAAAAAALAGANPAPEQDARGAEAVTALSDHDADFFRNDTGEFAPEHIPAQAGDAGDTTPGELAGRELLEARKHVELLNRQLVKEGMAPVRALRTAPNAQFALARQIGKALGIAVHYVGANSQFEGVAMNGVAYLAEGMRNPELAIAGHEVLHALEQSNPTLGDQLRTQIRGYLREGVVENRQAQEYSASGFKDISLHKAEGEVLADINGAMWMDPRFWQDLAKADRSLFRAVAYKFMELAAKAVKALRSSRFDVTRLVHDVDAVRAILVATWAEHAQGGAGAGIEQPSPAFAAAGHDLSDSLDKARDAGRQFDDAAVQYGGRPAYDALKAAGGTLLSYPQWVMTKTPNFKQFYGDWEADNGQQAAGAVHAGVQAGADARGLHGGADAAAGSAPAFPGQSGPLRTVGGVAEHAAVEPAVYFHGSRSDVDSFDLNHGNRKDHGWLGTGVYVTTDADLAHSYAGLKQGEQSPNLMPLFVAVRNPYIATQQLKNRLRLADRAVADRFTAELAAHGHDGVVLNFPDGSQELVAFDPAAVKSAVGNNGAFDAGNANIVFSRSNLGEALANAANTVGDVRLPANYLVRDLFNKSGKISWWHKTIGTMENLAKRQPAFARVYDAVQSFIGDVSRYGVLAADMAPRLLPKLEDIADIVGKNRKKPLTAADTKAIGAPIFEGTLTWARDAHGKAVKVAELEAQAEQLSSAQKAKILIGKGVIDDAQNKAWLNSPLDFYDNVINKKFATTQLAAGVVWSDAELRDLFSLNDEQIGLYREFRAALDKSLTNLTISEMVKLGGKAAKGTLENAIAAPDLASAAALLRDHFVELARMYPQQADMHLDTAKQIMDLGDKGISLMDRGYAPLSRFGKYTVYVQEGGEQVYFGMFETQYEASRMARQMRVDHPQADVTHGTVSEDAYKLFAGVSPETIELFGSMVGLDSQGDAASTEVYQSYLKLAKNNRSSMKRMIQRKGIAGFSEDAGRVLAGFIYSNARLTAGNAHLGEVDEAITEIPKQQGELTDAAMQLRESIRNPEGGGNKLGGLMFAQFLGGSVASAMVNLTQPLTMTLPYLSQFGGLAKAGKQLAAAVRDAGKSTTGEDHLDKALQWAADEGIVAPQEIHYLQAQASGKGTLRSGDGTRAGNARATLNNAMSKVQLGWGKLFAMAELTNRRVTFIAAYRTAIEQGIANPAKFAEQTVSQTQGTYNSGNKPRWARGAIGGLLMTFKQYSIGYLELLTRMATAGEKGSKERAAGQRAALYMIAVLFLMSGADGLPFEQDLEDAIDGALQRLGYNFSTKRAKQAFLTDVLGQGGADFALKGISSMPGMPIDVAGRFGMGNLIPGTGLLTKKDSYTQDLGELAGPAGDLAKRAFTATGKLLGGDVAGAALDVAPASVRNVAKGIDMIDSGVYKDGRGYKVNDVSTAEGVMKIVGFQPNSTANIQDAKGQALNMIGQNRMRSAEIQEHWAQGVANANPAMVQEARAMRDDWNTKNPETPIRVSLPAIYKRVRSMHQDAINRTQKTAPAALKATVRNELREVRS